MLKISLNKIFSPFIKEQKNFQREKHIELYGKQFYVDALDSLSLLAGAEYEKSELDFIDKWIKPGFICVDVGANIGYFTVALARAAKGGCIHAFEPDPENFELLQKNIKAWTKQCTVKLYSCACDDSNSEALLYKSTENKGMHRLYDSVCCQGESIKTKTMMVDDLIDGRVDFLKNRY